MGTRCVHFYTFIETDFVGARWKARKVSIWGFMMVGRAYLSRQVMALLNFARATNNPELAAVLVQKAASLKSQADEIAPSQDLGPRAPDVVPVPSSRTD